MNHAEFYKAYTESFKAWALAERDDQGTDYQELELTLDRKYQEGFKDAMEHAFTILTGQELDPDEYETTCDDYECDGFCDKNYCLNHDEGYGAGDCRHSLFSTSPRPCSQHGEDADCWEATCDNCNKVVGHAD